MCPGLACKGRKQKKRRSQTIKVHDLFKAERILRRGPLLDKWPVR